MTSAYRARVLEYLSAVVAEAEATMLRRQAIKDAEPAGQAISPSAPTGNAILVPAPAGPEREQESLGIQQDRGSGGYRRAPQCQGKDANGLAQGQHVGTSRGM